MFKLPRYIIPSTTDLFFIAIFCIVIAFGPRLFSLDGDLGRHITIGNYILDQRTIPKVDVFSHTMSGQALTPHEWLAQVIFASIHRFFGLDGIVILTAIVIASAFSVSFVSALETSKARVLTLLAGLVAAAASSVHWLSRPHIFTFLFFSIWLWFLLRLDRGRRVPLWTFPGLMLLWANTHGAFITGFVVWGGFLIGWIWENYITRQKRRNAAIGIKLTIIGFTSFAASLLNPAGLDLWFTSVGYIQNRYLVGHTFEYLPPNFHNPGFWPFLLLVLATILLMSQSGKMFSMAESLLMAGWTVMGLYSARNIPLYTIVWCQVMIGGLESRVQSELAVGVENNTRKTERKLYGGLWPLATILIVVVMLARQIPLDIQKKGNAYDQQIFPVQAVDWLVANNQQGNMFNYFDWGGYILYRMWPEQRVFIDGQTDFYGEALTRQYEKVITLADGWQDILNKHQVVWVIMPTDSALIGMLDEDEGWETLYSDSTATILRQK